MVNRCVCYDVPFWTIAELAKKGKTFEQICDATSCCKSCGNCEPYVRVVIRTLAHRVPVMTQQQMDEVMAEAHRCPENGSASASTTTFHGQSQG